MREQRTMAHEKVVQELRMIRKHLRREMETAEIAALAGVTVQTLKQYCQLPGSRGARLIPGERLDELRLEFAQRTAVHWSHAQVPWHCREERLWHVFTNEMIMILEVTDQLVAASCAARHGLAVCLAGERNPGVSQLTAVDRLCLEWLDLRHSGLVTKSDAMAVTRTDEWTEGLVGFEMRGLRIVPTRSEVEALRAIVRERSLGHAA